MRKSKQNLNPKEEEIIEIIAKSAEAKQASDIKILDIRKGANLVDFVIIFSGESEPQIRALQKEIDKQLRNNKIKGFRWEGIARSGWIVLDLGNIVVHLMKNEEREYYNLEELWEKDAIIYHY